jgi:hypothetical protein
MSQAQGQPKGPEPVERFQPTSGRLVGSLSLAVILGLLVYLLVNVHTVNGLRLGAGLVFFAVLVWVTQLRPRATLYSETLHLQNSVRDVTVPLAAIEGVSVGRMLSVWAGEKRYVCTGIGTPLRKMVKLKSRGPSSLLGWDRLEAYTEEATPLRPDQSAMDYSDFVETRIVDMVEDAQRRSAATPEAAEPQVHLAWARLEIVALAVTGVLFLVTLLL